ncbi:hypothetical protein E6O75_ATG03921 [Venturia nashicola]|uniref:Uncharacterized protein n=1 Tax=Venturia nashicola TaxID=86259 RepID=A0A4Z1PCE2_9PEZI|nr:hypothetical protein E6O75_ATG03921 [Venturia nashicola]
MYVVRPDVECLVQIEAFSEMSSTIEEQNEASHAVMFDISHDHPAVFWTSTNPLDSGKAIPESAAAPGIPHAEPLLAVPEAYRYRMPPSLGLLPEALVQHRLERSFVDQYMQPRSQNRRIQHICWFQYISAGDLRPYLDQTGVHPYWQVVKDPTTQNDPAKPHSRHLQHWGS